MYILCFRMRSILDVPHLKHLLFHMPLGSILCHLTLDPLKVCGNSCLFALSWVFKLLIMPVEWSI